MGYLGKVKIATEGSDSEMIKQGFKAYEFLDSFDCLPAFPQQNFFFEQARTAILELTKDEYVSKIGNRFDQNFSSRQQVTLIEIVDRMYQTRIKDCYNLSS